MSTGTLLVLATPDGALPTAARGDPLTAAEFEGAGPGNDVVRWSAPIDAAMPGSEQPHGLWSGGVRMFAIDDGDAEVSLHDPTGRGDGPYGAIPLEVDGTDAREPRAVTLSLGRTSVAEDAGTTSVEVTATLGASADTATDITVAVTGDTADEGSDFSAVPDFTLTVAANSTSGTASFDITPTDDSLVEGDERLTVGGSGTDLEVTAATLTLTDDDSATLSVSVDSAAIAESVQDAATVTVAITNGVTFQHAQDIAVTLGGTAAAGRDYTFTDAAGRTFTRPYILVLPAQASSVSGAITAIDDDRDDDAETVTLAVAHSGAAFGGTQTITITDDDDAPALELSGLTLSTTNTRQAYPDFDADTLHYGVGCSSGDTVEVTPTATGPDVRISVAGRQTTSGTAVALSDPESDSVVEVVLSNSGGESRTYTIHCVPHDFPRIAVQRVSGAWDGLFLGSVNLGNRSDPNNRWSFLVVMDTNGVPRFLRKLPAHHAAHFRPQEGGHYPYGYLRTPNNVLVLLDRDLDEARTTTSSTWSEAGAGWADSHLDVHDFLNKPDGTSVIVIDDPVTRDLSSIGFGSFGTAESMKDERIIEVTRGGSVTEVWDSWERLEVRDCTQQNFTGDGAYSHFNSIELLADGHYLVSLKGCSQIVKIDSNTGATLWQVGRTNLSAAEWTANGRTAPYAIEGDPHGEFCGQHSAKLIGNGNLLLYDNGNECLEDPETGSVASGIVRHNHDFSRVVEYTLDHERRVARFLRQHSLGGAQNAATPYTGLVAPTDSGNWWISWGGGIDPDATQSITEVDPDTKAEVLHILFSDARSNRVTTRSYPIREDEFRLDPPPLTARIVEAPSRYYPADSERARVVVAFNRPVVDFATSTPSVSVTGATLDDVSPLVEAGQPANAYVFTVTGAGDDIGFSLLPGQGCASGAVCTLDGALLEDVPSAAVVAAEHAPVFTGAPPTRSIPENSAPGTRVGGAVTATDADNDPLTYTLDGADAASFTVGETSGQIRTRSGITYDYETNSAYSVIVRADDSKSESATIGVTITVTDVDEPPEIGGAARVTIEENAGTFVGSYTAADPEGGDASWLSLTGTDARRFTFDEFGTLSFVEPPDFDRATNGNHGPEYRVTVRASDEGGRIRSLPVTITVTNVNESPLIEGDEVIDVDEGHTGTLGTYTKRDPEGSSSNWGAVGRTAALTGADAGRFEFDKASGRLTFADPPDYEGGGGRYEVTLNANDGTLNATLGITVTVANLEERGEVVLGGRRGVLNVPLQATLTDPDSVVSATWQWQRSTRRTGGWTDIAGAGSSSYTPTADDRNQYLRATVNYEDGHGTGKSAHAVTEFTTVNERGTNTAPVLPDSIDGISIPESTRPGRNVGSPVRATDPENDPLLYTLSGSSDFVIDRSSAQIRVADGVTLDFDGGQTGYTLTVTADDGFGGTDTVDVAITITDVNEAPAAEDDAPAGFDEDTSVTIDVLANDADPEDGPSDLTVSIQRRPSNGSATVNVGQNPGEHPTVTYTPRAHYHGADGFTYRVGDTGNRTSNVATVALTVRAVNDDPEFAAATAERSLPQSAEEGDSVGAPVTATDVDGDRLAYGLLGADAGFFGIDPDSGQITVGTGVTTGVGSRDSYAVTVEAGDGNGGRATVEVTITVTGRPPPIIVVPPIGSGPPGPSGPVPSEADFEWTVDRDIEALDEAHDSAAGAWAVGSTLLLLQSGDGVDDAIYAYDLESGERDEGREFALAGANRAPRGIWANTEAAWVSDSGQDRLFAYDLGTGERAGKREIVLARRNSEARGIWSDGETIWVLNRNPSLFAYRLETGELLGEYALADANDDPHGIWSDGVTVWVSNHDPKRLFAYRLPNAPAGPAGETQPLARVPDEEFEELGRVGNNSPRGIWSDGDVMYVADANDDRVYTYNMPDAIDARLASLSLEGVDIGEFSPDRTEYEGVPGEGVAQTTVAAVAVQDGASVDVGPGDADGDADGHQVDLAGTGDITVTVTSSDGSREQVYRVALAESGPAPSCLSGAVAVGFSLLIYEGGSVEELESCARSRHLTALYELDGGEFVPYILGAPEFVNRPFTGLFAGGVPELTPLTVRSDGPASADPGAPAVTGPWPSCLRGEIVRGFSHVLYEGGSVDDLADCAGGLGVTALYALDGGAWVPYILGAPEFVNRSFAELFADGVAAATPLVVRSE